MEKEKTEAERIAQGLLDAAKVQAEEILSFLKEKGFNDVSVSFNTYSKNDDPLGVKHYVMLNINAVIPNHLD